MKRRLLWLVVGVVALAGAVYVAAPIMAAKQLVAAAEAGDAQALERRVDFPAFRESLKQELNARLLAEMRQSDDDTARALGMLFGASLVSGVVDAFVTPDAIAVMVREAEAPDPDIDAAETAPDRSRHGGEVRHAYGFRDPNTFTVTLTDPDRPDEPVVLLMRRQGVIDWKLAGIDLADAET